MRVALYARVSTTDKNQDPESQLVVLRDYCQSRGYTVTREYVDRASATDLRGRTAWRELLRDAGHRKFSVVVVFKLDRAFRSSREMQKTLEAWEMVGVGFISAKEEAINTTTPTGRLLLAIVGAIAEWELDMVRVRVASGMERARREGKRIGRPTADDRAVRKALAMVESGASQRRASEATGVSPATIRHYRALQERVERGVPSEAPETAL